MAVRVARAASAAAFWNEASDASASPVLFCSRPEVVPGPRVLRVGRRRLASSSSRAGVVALQADERDRLVHARHRPASDPPRPPSRTTSAPCSNFCWFIVATPRLFRRIASTGAADSAGREGICAARRTRTAERIRNGASKDAAHRTSLAPPGSPLRRAEFGTLLRSDYGSGADCVGPSASAARPTDDRHGDADRAVSPTARRHRRRYGQALRGARGDCIVAGRFDYGPCGFDVAASCAVERGPEPEPGARSPLRVSRAGPVARARTVARHLVLVDGLPLVVVVRVLQPVRAR